MREDCKFRWDSKCGRGLSARRGQPATVAGSGDIDDELDRCRHGKTADEYCEVCDTEVVDLRDAPQDIDLAYGLSEEEEAEVDDPAP